MTTVNYSLEYFTYNHFTSGIIGISDKSSIETLHRRIDDQDIDCLAKLKKSVHQPSPGEITLLPTK